jgi:serine/threonine-protein kinase
MNLTRAFDAVCMARRSRTQTINLFLFSQYLNWHEILAKKTRIYDIAMQTAAFAVCGSSVGNTIHFKCGCMRRAAFIARLHSFNLRIKNRGPQKRRPALQSRCYARYSFFSNNSVRIRAAGELYWPPMKICHTCQKTYSNDHEYCPRDGSRLAHQVAESGAQLVAGLARHFRIVRRLDAGGMGAVFLAEQIGVGNRPVALKVLSRKLLDDPEFLLRFQNEAASTGRIHHVNVVTIYESGQADDGTPYIAMEFLEGESLRQVLALRGALPVAEVAEILQQAARGLNAAHKLGIIHRDLKPDNIFLTRGDEDELIVKIVDFGIAKLRESPTHTQTGKFLGTPAYMSFEQASGMRSEELDARSDIYSLGVVVYEMLSGRVPFRSDTFLGYVDKHKTEAPPPFHTVAPGLDVPPAVESAVMKALMKDRGKRHASALHFAHEITSAAQPTPPTEAPVKLDPTVIVPPTVREVNQPLGPTIDISLLARKRFPASLPRSASAPEAPPVTRQLATEDLGLPLPNDPKGFLEVIVKWFAGWVDDIRVHERWPILWPHGKPTDERSIDSLVRGDLQKYVESRGGHFSVHDSSGLGPVDYSVSFGRNEVVVELNLGHAKWRQGIDAQLATYMKAKSTWYGVFVLFDFAQEFGEDSEHLYELLKRQRTVCGNEGIRIDIAVISCDKPTPTSRRDTPAREGEGFQWYPGPNPPENSIT